MNAMRDFTVTGNYNGEDSAAAPTIEYVKKDLPDYLAKVRGPGPSAMKFNLRPRPRGDAAAGCPLPSMKFRWTRKRIDTKYPTTTGAIGRWELRPH